VISQSGQESSHIASSSPTAARPGDFFSSFDRRARDNAEKAKTTIKRFREEDSSILYNSEDEVLDFDLSHFQMRRN
jgi:hypothetical protein